MTDFLEIERMTLYEYSIRMTAYRLKELDERKNRYELAWASQRVRDEKNVGSEKKPKLVPVYSSFDKFFDYEKQEKEILGNEDLEVNENQKRLTELMMKANL